MQIYVDKAYLWMPVDKKKPEVKLHFYCDKVKIQEIDIQLGGTDCDFYTAMDVSRYLGKNIEIAGDAEEHLHNIFCCEETVQNIYPFRPKVHFSPYMGWHNDPNGLVYADGIYHLYYQWNPYGVIWGNMHWGHAVSRDLITWEHRPMVMEPDEYGTVYSGCGWPDTDNAAGYGEQALLFFYTAAGGCSQWSQEAGNEHVQRLAVSTDGGETLQKIDGTLIGHIRGGNRDPKVFYHTESHAYIMALFMDENEFAIFRSEDLLHWKETQRFSADGMRECPDLFELQVEGETEKKWVFWSADGFYLIGSFDGFRFSPESPVQSAYSTVLAYAAQTYAGVADRVISISWLRLENDRGNYRGVMSLPTELSLVRQNKEYCIKFHLPEEFKYYRKLRAEYENVEKEAAVEFKGAASEIDIRWKQQERGKTILKIGSTDFTVDFSKEIITIKNPEVYDDEKKIPFTAENGLTLDIIADQEVIEFFGNNGIIYGAVETEENLLGKSAYLTSSAQIETVKIYELKEENDYGSKKEI